MEIAKFAWIFVMLIPVTYYVGYFTGKMDAEEKHAKEDIIDRLVELNESRREMEK